MTYYGNANAAALVADLYGNRRGTTKRTAATTKPNAPDKPPKPPPRARRSIPKLATTQYPERAAGIECTVCFKPWSKHALSEARAHRRAADDDERD